MCFNKTTEAWEIQPLCFLQKKSRIRRMISIWTSALHRQPGGGRPAGYFIASAGRHSAADIEALGNYWKVYPGLKSVLFGESKRKGYCHPKVEKGQSEKKRFFATRNLPAFRKRWTRCSGWKSKTGDYLRGVKQGSKPKELIRKISEDLLDTYSDISLIDSTTSTSIWWITGRRWCRTMPHRGHWRLEAEPIVFCWKIPKEKKRQSWTCDLLPPAIIVDAFSRTKKSHRTIGIRQPWSIGRAVGRTGRSNSGGERLFLHSLKK